MIDATERWALDELIEMLIDDNTGTGGQRNDDAVRLVIVCKILGIDVKELINKMSENFTVNTRSSYWLPWFEEHVDRVLPYGDKWVPDDNKALGTQYYINR